MDQNISSNFIRFFLLLVIQVLVLNQIHWGWGGEVFLQVHLYPLFILLLPFRTPRLLVLLLGFVLGIAVDIWSETYALHAGALVFTAFMRQVIIFILTPREGYNIKDSPTKSSLGQVWFFRYAALMLLAHLFFYFSLEAFTFVYFKTILIKVCLSWFISMLFLLGVVYVTNPKG